MKYLITLLVMLSVLGCSVNENNTESNVSQQTFSVNFEELSFAEAKIKAKNENKMLMVDVYATWCAPCKRLDKAVFKDKKAGEFINTQFVSIKIDGEKGEGPDVKELLSIPGYPTVLLFDPEGNEIDRIVGFGGDKESYLQTMEDYINGKNTLKDYLSRIESERNNVALNFNIATKYLYREEEQKANKYYKHVIKLDPENQSGYKDESGYQVAVFEMNKNKNTKPLYQFVNSTKNKKYIVRGYSGLTRYHRKNNNINKLIETHEECLSKLPENASMMNSYAWDIFKLKLEDKYDRGIQVAKKAVEIEPEAAAIWDTLAQLQFQAGYSVDAIRSMERAIELDPEEESFQKLLEKYTKSLTNA